METSTSVDQSQDPTSQDPTSTVTNSFYWFDDDENCFCWYTEKNLFPLVLISIWPPMALVAIYAIYYQVRRYRDVPVYTINLLISDIVQICCMVDKLTRVEYDAEDCYQLPLNYFDKSKTSLAVYSCGVMASIFSMIFIALERYLVMASPLWCRYKKKTQVSVSVCAVSWILSAFIGMIHGVDLGGFLLIPLPFLTFLLVWTIRARFQVQSSKVKRRVVTVLVVVLFNYTLMFLPQVITQLVSIFYSDDVMTNNFFDVSCILMQLNPLTNLLLCVSVINWIVDKLCASLCFCRTTHDENQQMDSTTTCTEGEGEERQ